MSIKAHLEDRAGARDARGAPRRALLLEVAGIAPGNRAAPVLIRNISATGMLLDHKGPMEIGETITIELPEAGQTTAEVVWASEGVYGCRFARPLSPAALSAAQLRSLAPVETTAPAETGMTERGAPTGTERETLSTRIQRLRKEAGLTLGQLAERLGVSKPTVWAWEQGRARPVETRMPAIAAALGVPAQTLVHARTSPELELVVERCRHEIAAAYGTDPEKVKIMVEL